MGNKLACCAKDPNESLHDRDSITHPKRRSFRGQYKDYTEIQRSGKLALEKE